MNRLWISIWQHFKNYMFLLSRAMPIFIHMFPLSAAMISVLRPPGEIEDGDAREENEGRGAIVQTYSN